MTSFYNLSLETLKYCHGTHLIFVWGTRQKKGMENSTLGSDPPPPPTAESVENFQKIKK